MAFNRRKKKPGLNSLEERSAWTPGGASLPVGAEPGTPGADKRLENTSDIIRQTVEGLLVPNAFSNWAVPKKAVVLRAGCGVGSYNHLPPARVDMALQDPALLRGARVHVWPDGGKHPETMIYKEPGSYDVYPEDIARISVFPLMRYMENKHSIVAGTEVWITFDDEGLQTGKIESTVPGPPYILDSRDYKSLVPQFRDRLTFPPASLAGILNINYMDTLQGLYGPFANKIRLVMSEVKIQTGLDAVIKPFTGGWTKAKPGAGSPFGFHNVINPAGMPNALAVDLIPSGQVAAPGDFYSTYLGPIALSHGLGWGGESAFYDGPHVQWYPTVPANNPYNNAKALFSAGQWPPPPYIEGGASVPPAANVLLDQIQDLFPEEGEEL